jgi:hypothetical protein
MKIEIRGYQQAVVKRTFEALLVNAGFLTGMLTTNGIGVRGN